MPLLAAMRQKNKRFAAWNPSQHKEVDHMETQGRICPRGASYYTWQTGDTLRSVAQQAGTTV